MEVSQAQQPAFATGATAATTGRPAPAISSDFETFLRMLTVQMTNQDPLNPIDSTDYAVQLATFSGVEQQVLTNELLAGLAGTLGGTDMARLAGWIGLEARAPGPGHFDGAPVSLSLPGNPSADQAVLIVRDADGGTVLREPLALTDETAVWDGRTDKGGTAPEGPYSFSVEHFAGGESLGTSEVQAYSRVVETRVENGRSWLVLAGGATIPADQVTALRDPV